VPARYIHSPASVIARKDFEAVVSLLKHIIQEVSHV